MSIFGGESIKMESCLKNKNEMREAFVYTEMTRLPKNVLKEFVKSKEAKVMVEEGILSDDTLERLVADSNFSKELELACCQLAKEANDPRWEEIISKKIELRDLMQDLEADYGETAVKIAENYRTDFIDKSIPKTFRA